MTSLRAEPSRSASGFRLMNMRPRLTEAFQPPPPTEEPTPATAGSASTIVERLLLQLHHRLEGDVGRGARAAEDQAGVVLREIALRRLDVEPHRERDGRERTPAASARGAAARRCRRARVGARSAAPSTRFDDAVEPASPSGSAPRATKCAQIIGVTVSDTTVETTIAKASVTENSRSSARRRRP